MTKTAQRLAELESKCRQHGLTRDEIREANALRVMARSNERRKRLYWTDPEYRRIVKGRAVDYKRSRKRAMEAAE